VGHVHGNRPDIGVLWSSTGSIAGKNAGIKGRPQFWTLSWVGKALMLAEKARAYWPDHYAAQMRLRYATRLLKRPIAWHLHSGPRAG